MIFFYINKIFTTIYFNLKQYGIFYTSNLIIKRIKNIRFKIINHPYEYVQNDAIKNFYKYLNVDISEIRCIVLIGGYVGYEIPILLKQYSSCSIKVFEPDPVYYNFLCNQYGSNSRVCIINAAVSNDNGSKIFFNTNIPGSGSLLTASKVAESSYGMRNTNSFSVNTVSLDNIHNFCGHDFIDLLIIDAQGSESDIFSGALNTLAKCKSILVEVSLYSPIYDGSKLFDFYYLNILINKFLLTNLGVDYRNGVGNAFLLNRDYIRHAK